MAKATPILEKRSTPGDAAVSGLFGGLGAGALMIGFLALAGLLSGQGAGGYLRYFTAGEDASPVHGLLTHLAVSGVYGMLYGLGLRLVRGRRLSRVPGWMIGMGYGILLWALAWAVLLPGTASPLQMIPPGWFAAAHAVYGFALGAISPGKR
jgi:hypothetical protein